MQTILKVLPLFQRDIGAALFQELIDIYPGESDPFAFLMSLPLDDRRAQAVLRVLIRHGFTAWAGFKPAQPHELGMELEHLYSDADCDEAPFLIPAPEVFFGYCQRNDAGSLQLEVDRVHLDSTLPEEDICCISGGTSLVISHRMRGWIEQIRPKGLVYRPVQMTGDRMRHMWYPFWEITGSKTMPAVSPSCRFVDRDGNPFIGSYERGCHQVVTQICSGLEIPVRNYDLRYVSNSLENVEDLDLLLTHERFGIFENCCRPILLASQRFRQQCLKHRLKVDWQPIRLEPG